MWLSPLATVLCLARNLISVSGVEIKRGVCTGFTGFQCYTNSGKCGTCEKICKINENIMKGWEHETCLDSSEEPTACRKWKKTRDNLRSWSEPSSFLSSLLFINGNFRENVKFFFFRSNVDCCSKSNPCYILDTYKILFIRLVCLICNY